MTDQVRVDRASIQTHADDTRSNLSGVRSNADDADRQTAHVQHGMNGGIGSDELQGTRAATQRHSTDIDTNVNKLVNRTSENTDEFLTNVRGAANKSLNTIK